MLAGHHHAGNPAGQAEQVLHRHLGLAVRPQPPDSAKPSGVGQHTGEAVGQHHRQGQQRVRLQAGIAVHHSLVPRPGLPPAAHCRRDVQALVVGDDFNLIIAGGVSYLSHRPGNDGGDVRHCFGGDLPGHGDLARRGQYLAGHPGPGVLRQAGVQHLVRDGVAHLVRVSFCHRLGGEYAPIVHVVVAPFS